MDISLLLYIVETAASNYVRTLVRIKVYPSSVYYHGSPSIFSIPIFVLRWVQNRRASVSRPLRRRHLLLYLRRSKNILKCSHKYFCRLWFYRRICYLKRKSRTFRLQSRFVFAYCPTVCYTKWLIIIKTRTAPRVQYFR